MCVPGRTLNQRKERNDLLFMRNKFYKKQYSDISMDWKVVMKLKKERERLPQTSSQASFLS